MHTKQLLQELDGIDARRASWQDEYDPPNDESLRDARAFARALPPLRGVGAVRAVSDACGGAAIYFFSASRRQDGRRLSYVSVDFDNDGGRFVMLGAEALSLSSDWHERASLLLEHGLVGVR